ncbi:Clip domain-containing protein [Caenorhabditis elegans]|uniref:Clip domain-containing protein n=1 Tax=Caenorhabditis elegans TaxID=6239 RepID=Q7JP78_CAEEL|nr:Clip domain-containing protein [Caenorhabditis elegans]CCD70325.1 Clip domain-containing protein [Caenorhabditis elegans]|eukprot:NP_001022344.2 Uncharacterized protein CELE_T13C2.3 [Caenorhabditis elegans]
MNLFCLFLLIILHLASAEEEYDIPLAPYNVKLMCRQGRRFSKAAQATNQCPTSSTSCGYFEFSSGDQKNGNPTTGVYDCVDGGILFEDSGEVDDDLEDRHRNPAFSELCGAIAKCTTVSVDKLNPSFVKYVVQEYDIKLELLENTEIRFCCALFHSTLQRLVTSPTFSLPEVAAPPVSCQGKMCAPGAVGCLLHAVHGEEYDDYEEETKKRYKRLALNDYIEDEDDYVNAVELNFEDTDLELITREPPVETTTTTTLKPTLPSLKLPMSLDDLTTTKPMTTTTSSPTTTASAMSKSKTFNTKHSLDEDEEEEPHQSTHCVYRHLNNEFYRYCLLVHQSRDGDRCYHHQGHTICCCFVAPDKESCDPTEMDLIVPPPMNGKALPPRVIVTIPPSTTSTTTSTTTTTTTTTTEEPTTTTTSAPTTTTPEPSKYPPLPPQIYRPRPIDQMKRRKQTPKKCRVAYVRTKSGSRTRPVLVCDSASAANSTSFPIFLVCSFVLLLQVFNIYI